MSRSILVFFVLCTGALAETVKESPIAWKKQRLTQEFWAEGACAGDVDKDGNIDVLCGPFWYGGPGFTNRHEIYAATNRFSLPGPDGQEKIVRGFRGYLSGINGYSDNFLSFTGDVDLDGWLDYIVVGHPGNETYWFQNPRGAKETHWKRHLVLQKTDNESPAYVDVTGDGIPELVCMREGTLGFAQPDPSDPTAPWKWNPVARNDRWQWNTHGLGYGDVNGDGRIDLITAHNWWEQPVSNPGAAAWKKHDAIFNNGGSQMFAYDVDGDAMSDVITAYEAHGYGIYWYKQLTQNNPEAAWKRFVISGDTKDEGQTGVVFSQPHALDLADIDGDGLKDIVTGKRFWAHGPDGDAEPNAPAVIYWFQLKRDKGKATYVAHLIDDDSGVGTQVMAVDINQDGKLDVLAGNKKGLFIHWQQ